MGIKDSCKQILNSILKTAISNGTMKEFFIDYSHIMEELNIENRKYIIVCFQYLTEKNYIKILHGSDVDDSKLINVSASAIDFLED